MKPQDSVSHHPVSKGSLEAAFVCSRWCWRWHNPVSTPYTQKAVLCLIWSHLPVLASVSSYGMRLLWMGLFSWFFSSGPLVLVYGKTTEFCMLILYSATSVNLFIRWKSLLGESLGCSNYWVIPSAKRAMTLLALKRRDPNWLPALSLLC